MALELIFAWVRAYVVGIPLFLALWIGPYDERGAEQLAVWISASVALALPLAALLALLGLPGGGLLTRWQLGARWPSERERLAVADALAQLPDTVAGPRWLYVIDDPTPSALVVGQALYLHRALIWDPALCAVIAHELAHVNAGDSRLSLAARRLTPFGEAPAGLLLGGLSLLILGRLWDAWMRRTEFRADAYAAGLGQGQELAAHLERHQFFDVAVPFLRGRVHPYSEQRIERLLQFEERPLREAA